MGLQLSHRLPADTTQPVDVYTFFSDLSPLANARRFGNRWDRLCSQQQVEANVEVLWQEQLAKNPLLFNASKFRLAGYSTEGDHTVTATGAADTAAAAAPAAAAAETLAKADTSLGEDGTRTPPPPPPRSRSPSSPPTRRLRLHLGLTDYRTFRGENEKTIYFDESCVVNASSKTEGGAGGCCLKITDFVFQAVAIMCCVPADT